LAPTGDYAYGVFEKSSGRYLGGTGLHRIDWSIPCFEIGYWLRVSAHGQGFITDSTRLLTKAAFETLGAARVEIRCDSSNAKSANVPIRLGFNHEATLRCARRDATGALSDTLIYALTWDDWREKLR
jgi:RimJ/RimL family protein N-acetyltransferase